MNKLYAVRDGWRSLLAAHQVIAIIRAPSLGVGLAMSRAVAAGGFRLIEITWNNNAEPSQMMAAVRQALPHCVIGAGSILTLEDLNSALAAGAQFCFTPHTDHLLIRSASTQGVPLVAGAMTPTEVISAWRAGASGVKVFPISALGNGAYIRSLLGPLGPIPLVPTGGVTIESAPKLIAAGAVAVGLSTALFPAQEVARGDWSAIEVRSRYLLALLSKVSNSYETSGLKDASSGFQAGLHLAAQLESFDKQSVNHSELKSIE
ncbi:MAG: bifunctional 4-hydroxy-2-oxoglutarate aldolase/2-dehydro-3-deoxy-phosphogluconate aldolase [Cyanobacteria bacterium P01_D01_bin.105]